MRKSAFLQPALRPVVLALGSGAAHGWAHIGVIRALQDQGVQIAAVAGTSIGAVVGAALAAGKLAALEDIARTTNTRTVLRYLDVSFKPGGMLGGRIIERQLHNHFSGLTLDGLAMPCAVIATDLVTGQEAVLRDGSVADAVRASLAIPGVFTPVVRGKQVLSDGGLVNPIPVEAARALYDAPVIAVNLQGDYARRSAARKFNYNEQARGVNVLRLTRASLALLLARLSDLSLMAYPADLVLAPKVAHIDVTDFTKADALIEIGKQSVHTQWPRILEMLTVHDQAAYSHAE